MPCRDDALKLFEVRLARFSPRRAMMSESTPLQVNVNASLHSNEKSFTQRRANEINAQLEAQQQAKESAELECSAYADLIEKRLDLEKRTLLKRLVSAQLISNKNESLNALALIGVRGVLQPQHMELFEFEWKKVLTLL